MMEREEEVAVDRERDVAAVKRGMYCGTGERDGLW